MPERMDAPLRLRLQLSGQVQGVGLRYRARHAASLLGLSGWVENCDDGTVLLEVQGPPEALARFLPMVQAGTYVQIEHIRQTRLPTQEHEYGFSVRGY